MSDPARPDPGSHVSDLAWDRWLAGELDRAEVAAADGHAAACVRCAARRRELVAERDAFVLRPRLIPTPAPTPTRRSRWWWAAPLAMSAAAAAAALVLWPASVPRPPAETQRKGDAGVVLTLLGGGPGRLRPLASGDTIHPGQSLQATYRADVAGFGAVIARDGAGRVSAYAPVDGPGLVALPAGQDVAFPTSTVLDDVIGPERVLLVWCATDHPLAALTASVAVDAATLPAGCTGRSIELRKQVAP